MEEDDPMVRVMAAMSLERSSKSDQRWVRCITTICYIMEFPDTGALPQQKLLMMKLLPLLQGARVPQLDCCHPATAMMMRRPRSQPPNQKDRFVTSCFPLLSEVLAVHMNRLMAADKHLEGQTCFYILYQMECMPSSVTAGKTS